MQTNRDIIANLAREIIAAGFRAFIAERGTYGFYTDAAGSHVVTFSADLGGLKYSGTYVTEAPQRTGTGWGLDTETFAEMFNQPAPHWATQGVKWRHATLKDYLAAYGSSSRFQEVL